MGIWQGKKVRLRGTEPGDAKFLQELYSDCETEVLLSSRVDVPKSDHAWTKQAEEWSLKKPENDAFNLIIEDLQGQPVGVVGPHNCSARNGVFRYGIVVHRDHRRKGYAAEAAVMVLRYCFEHLRYQKANAGVFSFNAGSIALHERLGFVKEGCVRRSVFVNGQYYDCYQYGMTVEEFHAKYGKG